MISRVLAFLIAVVFLPVQISAQTAEPAPAAKPAAKKTAEKPAKPVVAAPEAPAPKAKRSPWWKKNKTEPVTPPPAAPLPVEQPKKPKPPVDTLKGYMGKVKAALGKRWADAVQPRMNEFTPGNVDCRFVVDAEGKVGVVSISANTSTEAFGKFCEEFIMETTFDKPPEKLLVDGQMEIPFTFWIY